MSEQLESLPALLVQHANDHPNTIAIRQKCLGLWQEYSWQALLEKTQQFYVALQHSGFQQGQSFLLVSHPQVNVIALALAIHAHGGVVKLLDQTHELPSSQQLARYIDLIKPDFVLFEQCLDVEHLKQLSHIPQLLFYHHRYDEHVSDYSYVVDFSRLLKEIDLASLPELNIDQTIALDSAFSFERLDETRTLVQATYSHQYLMTEAKKLAEHHQVQHDEDALIARAFSSVGHIRYLWPLWLLKGFTLNIPETLATRDQDRQMIAPSLVLGTPETYHRIWQLMVQRLPQSNHGLAKLYQIALDKKLAQQKNNVIEKFILGLFKQVILEELGFSRLKTALIVGEAIDPNLERFFKGLDIRLQPWGESTIWQSSQSVKHHAQSHVYSDLNAMG